MDYSTHAKILSAEDIKEDIANIYENPTIGRMMFIETREKEGVPGKVFPCYMLAWAVAPGDNPVVADKLMFQAYIFQSMAGDYSMVEVVLHEKEFGVNKRIWDNPPTQELRKSVPWIDSEVAQ